MRPETGIVPRGCTGQSNTTLRRPALHSPSSYVQVPISAAGKVLGVVYVGSEREQEFGSDVLRILYTVASQAADSIQRLRGLLADEQQRLKRLVENLPEGILLLDATNRILLTNPIAEEILSVLGGQGTGDILTHLGPYPIEKVLLERQWAGAAGGQRPQGPVSRLFEVSAHPYCLAGSVRRRAADDRRPARCDRGAPPRKADAAAGSPGGRRPTGGRHCPRL